MSAQPQPTDLFADALAERIVERIGPYLAVRKRLYSATDAAEYLGIARGTFDQLVAAGEIPCVRPASARKPRQRSSTSTPRPWRRFDLRDLDRWIEEGKVNS